MNLEKNRKIAGLGDWLNSLLTAGELVRVGLLIDAPVVESVVYHERADYVAPNSVVHS